MSETDVKNHETAAISSDLKRLIEETVESVRREIEKIRESLGRMDGAVEHLLSSACSPARPAEEKPKKTEGQEVSAEEQQNPKEAVERSA